MSQLDRTAVISALLRRNPKPPVRHVLPPSEIAAAWRLADGPEFAVPIAVAVALAESAGDMLAMANDGRVGLWQAPAGYSELLTDPYLAAQEAVGRSRRGTDWSEFPAYTLGIYRQFMETARTMTQH